jgi:heme transport system permease protein
LKIFGKLLGLPVQVDARLEAVYLAIRLPRVLVALLFGAGLGVAGTAIQGLFRNPLADPGLIGVSNGSALGAVTAIVLSSRLALFGPVGEYLLPLAAGTGGLLATWLVYWMARDRTGRVGMTTLLLAGIAVSALAGAVTGLLTFSATDAQLRTIVFWSFGSLGNGTWDTLGISAPFILGPMVLLCWQARALNALLLGEQEAGHLGFDLTAIERIVVFFVAIMVGATVAFAGVIGFLGLVVPHLLRLWMGPDHRWLLPSAGLLGATLLGVADLICRTLLAPAEIPIGILTAMVGVPFFLWLIRRVGQ